MVPDEPTDEERQEALEQDNETPFRPADPNPSPTSNTTDPLVAPGGPADIPTDHPQTDTNIDSTELYDEGVSGAAEVEDQSSQSAVVDKLPPAEESPD
jgi:hypothetical protein